MEEKEAAQKSSFINLPLLLKACRKNWKWVAASVIVFATLGVIFIIRQQSGCEISAQVLISDESSSKASAMSDIANMFGGSSSFGSNRSIEDEMVVIKSHSLLRKTAEDLGLNESYVVKKNFLKKANVYNNQPVKIIYDKAIADTLGTPIQFRIKIDDKGLADVKVRGKKDKLIAEAGDIRLPHTIETPYGAFTLVTGTSFENGKSLDETVSISSYDAAALALGKLITVNLSEKKTDIMALSFITTDATYGRNVINALLYNYNQLTIEQKQAFHIKTLEFLEDRIKILAAEVDSTESQVEDFMSRRDLVNPEAQAGIYINRTSNQEVDLVKAESEYELLNMAIEFLSNEANNTSMLPIMPSTASLTPLINGYNELILSRLELESSAKGDNMALKAINTRINAVRDNLLAALNKQSETASYEINELRRQFAKSKNLLGTMPGIEREYTNILRQQTLKEQLYVFLLRQREETEMAIAGAHPRGVIIDEAFVTDTVVGMSRKVTIAVFIMLGLLFPAGIILLKWTISRKVSIIDQAVDASGGRQVIANIPLEDNDEPTVVTAPESTEALRIRLLRDNLLSIDSLPSRFVAAVTPTVAESDDAARIALNLAVSCVLTGRRTVLIDANPFNPTIATLARLNASKETDGMKRYSLNVPGRDLTADVLAFETDPVAGADKIASLVFANLISRLHSDYDAVILCTPSVSRHYASVETINRLTDITLAAVTTGVTLKSDAARLAKLDNHDGRDCLIDVRHS